MTRRTSFSTASSQLLTAADARRIAIHAQGLALTADRPRTVAEVLARTGAVQLDTVSVLARSHELVAYARLGPIGRAAVEDAYWGTPARAFEYYAHANCILPIESWPYFAFRRKQMGGGHWARASASVIAEVRARLPTARSRPAISAALAAVPAGGTGRRRSTRSNGCTIAARPSA